MTESSTKRAYKSHVLITGNLMADKIREFRNTFKKEDGTRYSYKEAGMLVIAAFQRQQPEQ